MIARILTKLEDSKEDSTNSKNSIQEARTEKGWLYFFEWHSKVAFERWNLY